jgi:hypothetical protein
MSPEGLSSPTHVGYYIPINFPIKSEAITAKGAGLAGDTWFSCPAPASAQDLYKCPGEVTHSLQPTPVHRCNHVVSETHSTKGSYFFFPAFLNHWTPFRDVTVTVNKNEAILGSDPHP